MKVLITGATGFLGSRTLELLSNNNTITEVIATGRVLKPYNCITHEKITYRLGDLTDKKFVRSITENTEYIVNAASLSKPWGRYNEFYSANVISQRNLIEAAKGGDCARYIYISTPSIYYNGKSRLNVKESDELPKKFINAYTSTKRMAEIELEQSGLNHIILRPRALIGRWDTVIMPRLITAFKKGRLKIIGNGVNIVDLTSVSNAARAIELAMFSKKESLNQVYNITNGQPVNLWNNIKYILNLLGYEFEGKSIPYTLVNMAAQLMEWKSKLTDHSEPALTVYSIGTLTQSFTLDISKARKLLGYNPLISIEDACAEFVNWYKKEHEKS